MMIFTPSIQFDHEDILCVSLLPSRTSIMPGEVHRARLSVAIKGDLGRFKFYGEEALSVVDQLHAAGYYTEEQHRQVRSLMQSYQLADMYVGPPEDEQ